MQTSNLYAHYDNYHLEIPIRAILGVEINNPDSDASGGK